MINYEQFFPGMRSGFPDYVQEVHSSGRTLDHSVLSGLNDSEWRFTLHHAAMMQRGRPETAMNVAQRALGGGVLSGALEHVGDLSHRMGESYATHGGVYNPEFVAPKVRRMQDLVTNKYGFWREHDEQMASNRQFSGGKQGDPDAVNSALSEYRSAHLALPVYTQPQNLAKVAAVGLTRRNPGERYPGDTAMALRRLGSMIETGDYQKAMTLDAAKAYAG